MPSILITGATNGLGLALAEELVQAGHQLLLREQPVTGHRHRLGCAGNDAIKTQHFDWSGP
ncbi:hypothetical protein L612_001400000220 [Rhodococcus rhodochrous J38]|uniref:hypothetical protein n=1 Tax=Rhodococcus rhodochrous TaxID=1829 RepID=UPI0011A882B7|nr:hypothetical protein [Rhodococcus rhodochrous]TWH61645.1 hypothetical protein L612_001400000220 [Rhodococcus rhodochrous J38]